MIDLELTKVQAQELGLGREIISLSPLPPGYGMTLGNSFRRILLASMPGAAVTGAHIAGVTHEFSVIPGVKESVVDILLNLKYLRVRKFTEEPVVIKLKANKPGPVTAKMIDHGSEVEVVNGDMVLCTLESKGKIEMEIRVESGVGYLPVSSRPKKDLDATMIPIDALFSPIKKVRYEVSNTRVGQMTNLEKLDIELETDGSVSPKEVVSYAARILSDYASLLNFNRVASKLTEPKAEDAAAPEEASEHRYTPVESLKLTQRTLNALINNDIGSVEELVQYNEKSLQNLKGFGKKALTEVKDALKTQSKALAA